MFRSLHDHHQAYLQINLIDNLIHK